MGFLASLMEKLGAVLGSRGKIALTLGIGLGSGYSVSKERQAMRARLIDICLDILRDDALAPHDDVTFCNVAIRKVAGLYGYDIPQNTRMNDIIDLLDADVGWHKDNGIRAAVHAECGGLALAAKKYPTHGHGAVIFPAGYVGYSPSWRKKVPFVANVGKSLGIVLVSAAFPVEHGEPNYYLCGETP